MRWLLLLVALCGCRDYLTNPDPIPQVDQVERPDSTWMCKTEEVCGE